MSAIVDAIVDFVSAVVDAIVDVVQLIWDEIVMPILEELASLIGIDDETVVDVKKVSIALYEDNTQDVIQVAVQKAVFEKKDSEESFYPIYARQLLRNKAEIRSYHKYGDSGNYIHGLPQMSVRGQEADLVAIGAALDTDTGQANTILQISTLEAPNPTMYFRNDLQASHSYLPYNNTLTHLDPYSVSRSDWTMDSPIVFNVGPDTFSIPISRLAVETRFWIDGPLQITEGDTAVYTIRANRTVPVGTTVTCNLTYSGTAVDTLDYTQVANVVMLASTSSITVSIVTLETGNANRNYTITLSTITNTTGAFEEVTVVAPSSVATTITDDDSGLLITMSDVLVGEGAGNATVVAKLETAAAAAFTVDYTLTNGTAVGVSGGVGADFDNDTGTLNFAGTLGETQNIIIPITSDIADDDYETFTVGLTNCSDPLVDITRTATVTIVDGSADPIQTNIVVNDTITKPNYTPETTLVVRYHLTTDPDTDWFYWFYRFSTLVYPNLEMSSSTLTNLEMLPVAVLRKDKVMANVDKDSQLYKTTRTLMQRLGLPIDDFITSVGDNPDINLIDDCYVNFAIGPNTNHKLVSKLLFFTYFELIVINNLLSNTDKYTALFIEGDINNATVWTGHTVTNDIVGSATTLGDYIHAIVNTVEGSDLRMRWQKSATTYDEIKVHNLNGMSAISYQTFHKMAVNKLGDDDFTIPLSWFVFNKLTPEETMIVYQHICRVDIYAIQVTELAWYQTSAFGDLFDFISIVLIIVSLGTATSFVAAMQQLLLQYAIGELIIWVAEVTGSEELAAIVGLVAQIYISGGDFSFEDLTSPETLRELATQFAENFTIARGTLMAIEIEEAELKAEQDEQSSTTEIYQSAIETEFLMYLQSVDTTMFPAIQGQYQFDAMTNYDSLIADFYDNNLQTGVV